MPIPTPNKNEKKADFINRCMADPTMAEYDQNQRYAVCQVKYATHGKNKRKNT